VTTAKSVGEKWNRWFRAVSLAAAVLLCVVALSRCSHTSETSGAVKRYGLRGEIVRLDPQTHAALIKHEQIEGWMKAMTMEYPVKDNREFQALHEGDRITATVFVRDLDYWIGEIHHEAPREK
jgi:protein SCO1/2